MIEFFATALKIPAMDNSQPSQFVQYIPILFLLAAAVGFAGGTLMISVLLGKFAKSSKASRTPPTNAAKTPIGEGTSCASPVKNSYLVAMLFILFDIEVVFHVSVGRRLSRHCWPNTPLRTLSGFWARWFRSSASSSSATFTP